MIILFIILWLLGGYLGVRWIVVHDAKLSDGPVIKDPGGVIMAIIGVLFGWATLSIVCVIWLCESAIYHEPGDLGHKVARRVGRFFGDR